MAQTLLSWMRFANTIEGSSIRLVEVNGYPGALGIDGQQRVLYVLSLHIADGQIQDVRSIVNPEKLRHLGPVSDALPTPTVHASNSSVAESPELSRRFRYPLLRGTAGVPISSAVRCLVGCSAS